MTDKDRKLYFCIVEAAMAKRTAAKMLLEEAERDLVRARYMLGEFEKENDDEKE